MQASASATTRVEIQLARSLVFQTSQWVDTRDGLSHGLSSDHYEEGEERDRAAARARVAEGTIDASDLATTEAEQAGFRW